MAAPNRRDKIVHIGFEETRSFEEPDSDPDRDEEEPEEDEDAILINNFLSWARPRWAMLQDLFPVVRQCSSDAVQSRGSITAEHWVKIITALGFPGDAWRI